MKVRLLVVILNIVFVHVSIFSLVSPIDSLLTALDKANKKEKLFIHNELSKAYMQQSPKDALLYAQKAYEYAKKYNNPEEEAEALSHLGAANFLLSNYEESNKFYQQALILYNTHQNIIEIANTFNKLGILHRDMNKYTQAEDYFNKALTIFTDLENDDGKAESINNIGGLYLRQHEFEKALEEYFNVLEIRRDMDDPDALAAIYNNIGIVYKEFDNHTLALDYHEKAFKEYMRTRDKRNLAATYNYIGNVYLKTGIYNKALESYFEALQLRKETNIQPDIAGSLSNIGLVYFTMNNVSMAEEYFMQSLEIYDETGNKKMLSITFNRLGNLYLKKNELKKSLSCFENALQISIELEDRMAESNSLRNIGKIYGMLKKNDKALEYYNKAIKNNNKIDNIAGNTYIYNEIGNLYLDHNELDKASEYFNKAIITGQNVDNKFIVALCYRKTGEILTLQQNYLESLAPLEKSLEIARSIKHNTLIQNAYFALYNTYYSAGNIQKALENYIYYSDFKDSIHNELNNKRITELQIKSEVEQREDLINSQRNEINIITQINRKQKLIITYLIVISILISLLVILLLNRFLLKKRTNEILRKQMEIIEETNEKLTKSENTLRLLNSTKDKFFSIIAHDLKNPIGAILGITEILTKDFDKQSSETLREYNTLIYDSSKQLFELLQNLLQWARSQTGKIQYKPEYLNVKDLIHENINLLRLSAKKKKIVLNTKLTDDEVYVDKEMINTVLRNIISNAVKFTKPGGKIFIHSFPENNHIQVSVKDSGIGMTKEELKKLFRLDVHHTTMGTLNEVGTGLGLLLCKEFVERNKGGIWVESEQGKGSKFIFTLPRKQITRGHL